MKTRSGKIYKLNNETNNVTKKVLVSRNMGCREILGFIIDILVITVILNILFLTLYLTKLSVRGKY
tara:strand:+ start:2909 stop:3106 length:198 start_codon:yes stop_codon:yes gene_type:complete